MFLENKINVFISYSWDNSEHQEWVLSLAKLIKKNGGNPIIDQDLKYGSHLRLFMERNLKSSDVVLMILTPNYKEKAQNLLGGVGFEFNIITKELFSNIGANEKYIGVLKKGSHLESVPDFIQDFKYVDLTNKITYNENLEKLIKQILETELKQPNDKPKTFEMEAHYKKIDNISSVMKIKAYEYFELLFLNDNSSFSKLKVVSTISDWEAEINAYNQALVNKFNPNKMIIAEDYMEDFKNNVFGTILWTVSAARRTINPDLARYKKDFKDSNEEEVYTTVNSILNASHDYVNNVAKKIDYSKIAKQEDVELSYLDKEEMFMNKVIGYGIRSELLHRYYPSYFPIMTQKSLWAMYFICQSAEEFITIEQQNRKGIIRVSHNWQYPYERFTFLMNELAKEIEKWVSKFGIKLNPEYRFGYVNMFLSSIDKHHKADINELHKWEVNNG